VRKDRGEARDMQGKGRARQEMGEESNGQRKAMGKGKRWVKGDR